VVPPESFVMYLFTVTYSCLHYTSQNF